MKTAAVILLVLALAVSAHAADNIVWIDGCQWVVVSHDEGYFHDCDTREGKAMLNTPGLRDYVAPFCIEKRSKAVWFEAQYSGNCTVFYHDEYDDPRFESFWATPTCNCKP